MKFLKTGVVLLFLLVIAGGAEAVEKEYIAVLDLEVTEGISETYVRPLSDRLRQELFSTGSFVVVERRTMEEVLKEQSLQLAGCTTNECAIEIGKVLGVRQMVAGSIGQVGTVHTVNIRLIDVETTEVIAAESVDCLCPIEDVLTSSLGQAADKLASSISDSLEPEVELEEVSTPEPETESNDTAWNRDKMRWASPSNRNMRELDYPGMEWADEAFDWVEDGGIRAIGFRFGWGLVPGSSEGWYGSLSNGMFVQIGKIGPYRTSFELVGGGVSSTIDGQSSSFSSSSIRVKGYRFFFGSHEEEGVYHSLGIGIHTIRRSGKDPAGVHHSDWEGVYGHLGGSYAIGYLSDLNFSIADRPLFTFAEIEYEYLFTSTAHPNGFLSLMAGFGIKFDTFGDL
jgi:TolB-like protein